jgi:hypothetical protein
MHVVYIRAPLGAHFHFALLCLSCKIWLGSGANTLGGVGALTQFPPTQGGHQAIPEMSQAPPPWKCIWYTSGHPWESNFTLPYSALLAKSGLGVVQTHSAGLVHSPNFHQLKVVHSPSLTCPKPHHPRHACGTPQGTPRSPFPLCLTLPYLQNLSWEWCKHTRRG